MAKLYFKYGTMGSSKTAQALMTRFNYMEKGQNVWLVKPSIDTRDNFVNESGISETVIKSRIGLSAKADVIDPNDNICELLDKVSLTKQINVIVVDEAQFLTEENILQLRKIVSERNIPVMCFGLRTDFRCKLFPGSKALFEMADSISEIKSICRCGNKSVVNARLDAFGNVISEGPQVQIGGNESYESMCWSCWHNLTT